MDIDTEIFIKKMQADKDMREFILRVDKRYQEHYRKIGGIKSRHENRGELNVKVLIVCVVGLFLLALI